MHDEGNGWPEYRKMVVGDLERLTTELRWLRIDIGNLSTDVSALKVKAGAWGAIAGAVVVAAALLAKLALG